MFLLHQFLLVRTLLVTEQFSQVLELEPNARQAHRQCVLLVNLEFEDLDTAAQDPATPQAADHIQDLIQLGLPRRSTDDPAAESHPVESLPVPLLMTPSTLPTLFGSVKKPGSALRMPPRHYVRLCSPWKQRVWI